MPTSIVPEAQCRSIGAKLLMQATQPSAAVGGVACEVRTGCVHICRLVAFPHDLRFNIGEVLEEKEHRCIFSTPQARDIMTSAVDHTSTFPCGRPIASLPRSILCTETGQYHASNKFPIVFRVTF